MDLGLAGRICVVTGASSGIGAATSRLLAADGAHVLMVARGRDGLGQAARRMADQAVGELKTFAVDVTAPDASRLIVAECERHWGPPDVLVNNAGTSASRPLEQLTDADWQGQWEINVMASMRLMRELAPPMAARGWGRIVNVCSSSGKRPSQSNMAYSVTKAAQLSLSRAFADLYVADGVLVNAVAPGPVSTPLWMAAGGLADQAAVRSGVTREEALRAQMSRLPRGRLGEPQEIAAVIVFLCSECAANVAGAAWSVDGGSVAIIV
jgi:3-oxoacyl-[acyl-carrier protein] reductase